MDDNYCAPLAAILRKAQGCIDRDTDELIDVGGEVSKLRRICDSQRATISRLRAELAKADGQINRCVEQNKYLESTISRLSEHLDCMIDYVCESNARYMVGALEAVREARKALEDGKP